MFSWAPPSLPMRRESSGFPTETGWHTAICRKVCSAGKSESRSPRHYRKNTTEHHSHLPSILNLSTLTNTTRHVPTQHIQSDTTQHDRTQHNTTQLTSVLAGQLFPSHARSSPVFPPPTSGAAATLTVCCCCCCLRDAPGRQAAEATGTMIPCIHEKMRAVQIVGRV